MDIKKRPNGISFCITKAPHVDSTELIDKNKHLYLDFGWLNLAFKNHSNIESHYLKRNHFHVILDGYISTHNKTLDTILEDYFKYGASSIAKLKGSFALCFIDTSQKSVAFFSDKRNSRSYFLSTTDQETQIATRVDFLARTTLKHGKLEINKQAVIQYLIRGAFHSSHTLFNSINKINAATGLTISEGTITQQTYWSLQYKKHTTVSKYTEPDLIEEGHQLIKNALEQCIQQFSDPILFLSGGVDSRVILGLLGDLDYIKKTAAITWGIHPIQDGDDLDTATTLANKTGINQQIYHFETSNVQNHIHHAISGVDCRVDILDSPALSPLWESLGNNYDCFINGDECFGWHDKVQNTDSALTIVGYWGLEKAARIADWIHPEERSNIKESLTQTLNDMVSRTHTNDANDQKDAIYYHERVGNILNGQLVSKLPYMHPVQPLLDEDVVEFVSRIPQEYRHDKYLLRLILQHKYPKLAQLPYASCKALPTTTHLQKVTHENQVLQSFLQKELFENINSLLTSLIDFDKVKTVYNAFFYGSPLPPINQGLLYNIPGLWRFLPAQENRVPPITGLFRVLALNIYLNKIFDR